MTTILEERKLELDEACRHPAMCHADGSPCSRAKIRRLWEVGVVGPDGKPVLLEFQQLSDRRITSHEAIGRFLAAIAPRPAESAAPKPIQRRPTSPGMSPGVRQKLQDAGLLPTP